MSFYICDDCGEPFDDDEAEFALITDDETLCFACNSYEGDVDLEDVDGRFED